MRTLYIFVTSERPDAYLNALMHCVLRCDVREIVFLHIQGFAPDPKIGVAKEGASGRLMGAVQTLLEALATRAEYVHENGERVSLEAKEDVDAAERAKTVYSQCRDLPLRFSNEEITKHGLRERLRAIAKDAENSIVDISAIGKRYVGDLVSAALIEGLSGLYAFELKSINFHEPWRMLFHVLDQPSAVAYEYTNVIDTETYRACASVVQVRAPRLKMAGSDDSELLVTRSLDRVEQLCRRFPRVARQVQDRHNRRGTLEIDDEYDVQDLFHALLRIDFDDIRDEEWTPSYAGRNARVDFLLKPERIIVEIKKTRKGLGPREVGDQLIIDIARYQAHPDCRSLVCFVYDPDRKIGNPRGLETDLSRTEDKLDVRVIVAPSD